MKPVSIILCAGILVLFLFSTAMSVRYLGEIASALPADATGGGPRSTMQWRAIVLLPDNHDPFIEQLAASLEQNAHARGVALEFRPLALSRDAQNARAELELAIMSHPHGLIVAGSADPEYQKLINRAVDAGMPVITVANDAPASRRQTFVGTNGFSLGSQAGQLINGISAGSARVGLILSQSDQAASGPGDQSILAGLAQTLKSGGQLRVTEVRSSRPGVASAEEIATDILGAKPAISVLFCTSAQDTIAAAQILVDQNRVGQVLIVGVDNPPELLEYLDKGVVSGTIVRNPDNLGRLAINAFVELKTSGHSSGFADPGLVTLTRSSVHGQ